MTDAARDGLAPHDGGKSALETVLSIGRKAVDLFLRLQGNGDLGPTVETPDGSTLYRGEKPQSRRIRTIFGEHAFAGYTYARGAKKKIELRPLDARMSLPEGEFSYLLEEFSKYFCVEQAFGQQLLSAFCARNGAEAS